MAESAGTPSESCPLSEELEELDGPLPWEKGEKKRKNRKKVQQIHLEVQGHILEEDLYSYDQLLKRARGFLRERNVQLGREVDEGVVRFKCPPPGVVRHALKTYFVNFKEVCQHLRRSPKHVMQFFRAETGTCCSVSGSDQLIFRGNFKPQHIEQILISYIKEYVLCHACRGPDTFLHRQGRVVFLRCDLCQAKCSVAPITKGFEAKTRYNEHLRRN